MAKKKKVSIAYTKYIPKKRTWKCYDKVKDAIVPLTNFQIVMMKNTKKFKPFYLNDSEIPKVKAKHDDLKTLRLSTIKDKAYDEFKERSTKHEIEHPFSNNTLFIDCYLNYNTEQYTDNLNILDAPDIQTISKAMSKIFKYYQLNKRTLPVVNALASKKISFKDAQYKIEQVIRGKAIRYIPFGSPLQKSMTKAVKHAKVSYKSILGGSDSNMFGLFYMEDKGHNIIKDILEKESD